MGAVVASSRLDGGRVIESLQYGGTCLDCGQYIKAGGAARHYPGRGIRHLRACPPAPRPRLAWVAPAQSAAPTFDATPCCALATAITGCTCMAAWRCRVHGDKHVGTHD